MDPRVPRPGLWRSERTHLWDVTDSLIPKNSLLDKLNRWARAIFWRKHQTGEFVLDVEGFGMRLIAGDITWDLKGCGVYGTTIDFGNGKMHLKMEVTDAHNVTIQQLVKAESGGDVAGAKHSMTRIGDSAVSDRREKEWSCAVAAHMALTWGAYAAAFGDETTVNEVAAESATVAEFRAGIDAAKTDLIKTVNDQVLDAVPQLQDLVRFRKICPSGADELGWINTETLEHSYNDAALDRLPPIIRSVVERHESIHKHQVDQHGEPGDDVYEHADYEAEAYQDSLNRLVSWINGQCQPGFIPDGYPFLAIAFEPSDP